MTERVSINTVVERFESDIKGKTIVLATTKNKGLTGQFLEQLVGIPLSSKCLDCTDGELKLFPLKKKKNGNWTPKETIAITMRGVVTTTHIPFEESDLFKKISNTLLVSYYREGDNVTFMNATLMNKTSHESLYSIFEEDYNKITQYYREHGVSQSPRNDPEYISSTINGTYIQGRTKGPGGSTRTVAFYFKSDFVNEVLSQK